VRPLTVRVATAVKISSALSGIAAVVSFSLVSAAMAAAAEPRYPSRPIRLVLPYPPGGGIDALARVLSPKLGAAMGQQWVVDNRSGAAGNVAIELVAKSIPDGHTLLMTLSTALTVNPLLYKNLPFDVRTDLQPITQLGVAYFLLVIHPSIPATTLKEFVAIAKAKPGQLNYASAGIGGIQHFASEQFKARTGTDIVHVPYKGGGPAALAVLAGEAQMLFASIASSVPHINAGKLRALGVTSIERSPIVPDVPTLDESGLKGFNVGIWYGLLAPAKTPNAIVKRLHDETVAVLKSADVSEALARQGQEVRTSTPAELEDLIKNELAVNAEIIKKMNIKAE
jgi:tripartite-type tricarboxylate transporter receptor subunit TctC